MPTKPPKLKPAKPRAPWTTSRRGTRQQRGYGRLHELMRAVVLREEPLCRECAKRGRVTPTTIADHIIPKAEGGTDDRENYQGLCDPCSKAKTAAESKRARARRDQAGSSRQPGG